MGGQFYVEITLKETDIQFNNRHSLNCSNHKCQTHANGKNSPDFLLPRFPYKIYREKYVFKRGMEKGMAKRTGKADMAKNNASVKMPNRRFIQKTKKARILFRQSYFEKKREREGKERMGRRKRKGKVSLYGPLASVYTDSIENA